MMRTFLAICIVVSAGCGDNLGDGEDLGTHGDGDTPVQDNGVVAKLLPEVCSVRSWPEVIPDAKDVDLAVVQMPQGAGILAVSRTGGYLNGFLTDARGLIMGDPLGTKIRTDRSFTGVSATVADGRLIVGLLDNGTVRFNVLRDDLEDYRELAVVAGDVISDAAVLSARGEHVSVTGGSTGLVTSAFDQAWAPVGTDVIARSVPTSMTGAAYGNDAIVAWSTTTDCHLQRVAAGVHSQQAFPCRNSRLAMDFDSRAGEMVYEAGDSVMLSNIRINSHSEIANEIKIASEGSSPRIAFDGHRYWVSYINRNGDLVVGYLDEDNTLVSMAIEGTRPERDAYDLAIVNGGVWLYSVDGVTGFGAHKLCLTR